MKIISDEIFNLMIKELYICQPDIAHTRKEIMDENCECCSKLDICKKLIEEYLE